MLHVDLHNTHKLMRRICCLDCWMLNFLCQSIFFNFYFLVSLRFVLLVTLFKVICFIFKRTFQFLFSSHIETYSAFSIAVGCVFCGLDDSSELNYRFVTENLHNKLRALILKDMGIYQTGKDADGL